MDDLPAPLPANVERFSGFAGRYDAYRPTPPAIIVDILTQLAGGIQEVTRPKLVVDLGSGTGLSTRIWAERAEAVVGIDPNPDMRTQAEARTTVLAMSGNVRYQARLAWETGLPDGCADIVTVSQALHWMEPEPTFAEVARILRPGGVFAAYDCDWPPTMNWEAEVVFDTFMEHCDAIERERGLYRGVKEWRKDEHLGRIRASGHFRYTEEIAVHHVEMGNAERLVGLLLSQGGIASLLKHGLSEEEIGVDSVRAKAKRTLGNEPAPWYWTYRVRLGIK